MGGMAERDRREVERLEKVVAKRVKKGKDKQSIAKAEAQLRKARARQAGRL
jgi:hypothetical protein